MWYLFNHLVSPKRFFQFANNMRPWLTLLFFLSFSYGLIGGLIFAPADYLQGDGFRIIYVHVPAAFLSLLIYGIMAGAAILGMTFRLKMAFSVIRHSAPIGAGFTLLALLTGSLWGKPMWGTWWIWDARLTSELILLFLYIGILLFQSAISQKKSGDKALAILILVGVIDIPIIHYSVYWWNTLHQGATLSVFTPSKIASSMLYPLIAMIIAFLTYYTLVLFLRINIELAMYQPHFLLKDTK
jgi:heme exporter protein C